MHVSVFAISRKKMAAVRLVCRDVIKLIGPAKWRSRTEKRKRSIMADGSFGAISISVVIKAKKSRENSNLTLRDNDKSAPIIIRQVSAAEIPL